MTSIISRFLLLLVILSVSSCDPMTFAFEEKSGNSETPGEKPGETPGSSSPATFVDIQSKILQATCTRCHSGERPRSGINLETYENIVSIEGMLKPGSPSESLLFTAIKSGNMPPRGEPVSHENLRLLGEWICRGAVKEGLGEEPKEGCLTDIPKPENGEIPEAPQTP